MRCNKTYKLKSNRTKIIQYIKVNHRVDTTWYWVATRSLKKNVWVIPVLLKVSSFALSALRHLVFSVQGSRAVSRVCFPSVDQHLPSVFSQVFPVWEVWAFPEQRLCFQSDHMGSLISSSLDSTYCLSHSSIPVLCRQLKHSSRTLNLRTLVPGQFIPVLIEANPSRVVPFQSLSSSHWTKYTLNSFFQVQQHFFFLFISSPAFYSSPFLVTPNLVPVPERVVECDLTRQWRDRIERDLTAAN